MRNKNTSVDRRENLHAVYFACTTMELLFSLGYKVFHATAEVKGTAIRERGRPVENTCSLLRSLL